MDNHLRQLERAAATDPLLRDELCRQRLRAGAITPWQLSLAAYCGDEWAIEAVGGMRNVLYPGAPKVYQVNFGNWLYGLARHFNHETRVRAAVAAARYIMTAGSPFLQPAQIANSYECIDAAQHCLDDSLLGDIEVWDYRRIAHQTNVSRWAYGPIREIIWPDGGTVHGNYWLAGIWQCTELTSIVEIITAVCDGLIKWALENV